jgi:competence protein ComEC
VFSTSLAHLLLVPLDGILMLIERALHTAGEWSFSLPTISLIGQVGLAIGIGLLLLPPGFPLRWTGLPLLLVAWAPRPSPVAPGEFHFHLLDVGQGLSAVVETHRHVLIFDTGPAYPSGFSATSAVTVPFLRRRGHREVDRLIVSHGDSDHGGGTETLLREVTVDELWSGEPHRIGNGAVACVAGRRWDWDGVRFTVLHPVSDHHLSGNNASCVLRVENAAGALLLTGDIEASVERRLIRSNPSAVQAGMIVAPHHGSRSSSGKAFVRHVNADIVLFATGWNNRYGFPDDGVAARWRQSGATTFDTAFSGTLGWVFRADGQLEGPSAHRRDKRRFWSHDPGSAEGDPAVSSAD